MRLPQRFVFFVPSIFTNSLAVFKLAGLLRRSSFPPCTVRAMELAGHLVQLLN
jgi:hypothetical protein